MKRSGMHRNHREKIASWGSAWKRCSKKKKGIAVGSAAVLLAGVVTAVVVVQKHSAKPVMAGSGSVIETTATTGTVSNTIVGTGNLADDSALSIKIPSGVMIDEVQVESGDTVSEGDVLATVDTASIYSAMEDVQTEINTLDAEINDCKDDTSTTEVTSQVDGRIKKIYISADDSISQVMLAQGAVMLISLDGKLAVECQTAETVAVSDDVIIQRADGTQIAGSVESVNGKTVVVTMSDSGIGMDESVSMLKADGTVIGSGTTYIHEQLALTATTGTVASVSVTEDEAVASGDTLYTIENDGTSIEYQQLTAKRTAYAETLQSLLTLAQTGTITADRDGTIASVLVSEGNTSSASGSSGSSSSGSSGSSGSGVINTSASGAQNAVVSGAQNAVVSGAQNTTVSGKQNATDKVTGAMLCDSTGVMTVGKSGSSTGVVMVSTTDTTTNNTDTAVMSSSISDEGSSDASTSDASTSDTSTANSLQFTITSGTVGSSQAVMLQQPVTGAVPQTQIATADGSYTGIVTWNPQAGTFAAATSYQAMVTLYAADNYLFTTDSVQHIAAGVLSGLTVSQDQKTMSFTITFPETAAQSTSGTDNSSGDSNGNSGADSGTGNETSGATTGGTTGSSGAGGNAANDAGTSGGTSTTGISGGTSTAGDSGSSTAGTSSTGASANGTATASSGSSSSGSTADSDTSDSSDTSASAYSTDVTAFTISPADQMLLSVNVDELDINSVALNQEATITFDALEDVTCTGKVTKIGNTGTVSGGVAKYTVDITIDKTDEMKVGMNASATIVIEQKEDVITIPVNALQERGTETYVYTAEDSDGNLSGEVTVTTGLSDGDTVEITDGLAEGDTVYYQKTGSSSSSGSSDSFGGFGGMSGSDGMSGSGGKMDSGSMPGGGGNMGGGTPPSM